MLAAYTISITILAAGFLINYIIFDDTYRFSEVDVLFGVASSSIISLLAVLNLIKVSKITRKNSNQRLVLSLVWILAVWFIFQAVGWLWNLPAVYENVKKVRSYPDKKFERIRDNYYRIQGPIGFRSLQSFKDIDLDQDVIVELDSIGGLIDPAIEIAHLIKKHSVPVYVKNECSSSCVLIAASSPKLISSPTSLFGFHRGSSLSTEDTSLNRYASDQATATLLIELRKNGLSEEILSVLQSTSSDSISYYSGPDLHKIGVVHFLSPRFED